MDTSSMALQAAAVAAAAATALVLRKVCGGGGGGREGPRVTGLWIYPVKSCRGLPVESFRTDRLGPEWDRRWVLAEPDGTAITARECPATVLVAPDLERNAAGEVEALVLRWTGREPRGDTDAELRLPVVPAGDEGEEAEVRIFGQPTAVARYTDPRVGEWLEARLGRPARLMTLLPGDRHHRPIPPKYDTAEHEDGIQASFGDAFPWLLATEESLASLQGDCPQGVSIRNFRPNIVVSGAPAWDEDWWSSVRVGGAAFECLKHCTRCVLTTACPAKGARNRNGEPLKTMRRVRNVTANGFSRPGTSACFFGINLVHVRAASEVRLGDAVEVLSRREQGDGV